MVPNNYSERKFANYLKHKNNLDKFDLEIMGEGVEFTLPINMQDIENIPIDGFVPLIINVTPVQNLPLLLGGFEKISEPLASL